MCRIAPPVVDFPALRRGLVALALGVLPFVAAFADDESRYERGERVMLEMMTAVLEQFGPAGLESSLKLLAFNINSFRQSEENWPALATVNGTTIRFYYVIPKKADSITEMLDAPKDLAPNATGLMHEVHVQPSSYQISTRQRSDNPYHSLYRYGRSTTRDSNKSRSVLYGIGRRRRQVCNSQMQRPTLITPPMPRRSLKFQLPNQQNPTGRQ